jgi:uncharacterized membrane protein YgcG
MSSQDVYQIFLLHLAPNFRETMEQVRKQRASEGTTLTWDQTKAEFLALTGEVYERTAEQMLWSFVTGQIKQSTAQTLAQYRTMFDINVRTAECIAPRLAAMYYVNGLRAELRARCTGDSSGRPFTRVDDAHAYAIKEERKLATKATAGSTVAAMQDNNNTPRKKSRHDNTNHNNINKNNPKQNAGGGKREGGGRGGRGGRQQGSRGSGGAKRDDPNPSITNSAPSVRIKDWNVRCTVCKGRGHTTDRCPSVRE